MLQKMTKVSCPVTLAGVLSLMGCSTAPQMDYNRIDLVDVSGTVTLDGEPLPDAVITFESVGDGTFSYGLTNGSGAYSLQFDTVKDGVTPGTKKVAVSTIRRIMGLNSDEEGPVDGKSVGDGEAALPMTSVDKVPECYNKHSKIQVDVSASTTTMNFDLKSDCSTTAQSP